MWYQNAKNEIKSTSSNELLFHVTTVKLNGCNASFLLSVQPYIFVLACPYSTPLLFRRM